jgi:benzoate-CoA ligase family protein
MDLYNAASWLVDRHVLSGNGDRVAFLFGDVSISYGELRNEILKRQVALVELGLTPGDRVAMLVRDEPGFPAWFLAAMRGGFIPVPLSTMLTPAEVAAVVDDSGAQIVVVSATYVGHLAAISTSAQAVVNAVVLPGVTAGELSGLNHLRIHVQEESAVLRNPVGENPVELVAPAPTTAASQAFWLYSSGTTGKPKGVMHRHGSLQVTADTYASRVLGFTSSDRVLSIAKLFFAFGLGNSLTFALAAGASAILHPDPPSPAAVGALLERHRPTLFFLSPGFVAAMLDAQIDPAVFSSVRLAVTAGEALPADLARRFTEQFGVPVLDGLGTTEALHIFLSNRLDNRKDGTSGLPVDGYEVELRDETGTVVEAADMPGYLHVRGDSVADGYWQRPEATADAFVDGWLRTGDVYTRSEDGFFTFLGRNNDMIKAGGIWVSPAEVESVLVEHSDVLEAAVVGARNEEGLESTVAFLVPRAGCTIDVASIDVHCRSRMASFKRPRRVIIVSVLPKTATGKIQRFALRQQLDS